jgi:hypothetical protein
VPPRPPPSPPLSVGRIYGNYTAKVQEVLQVGTITTSINPSSFTDRLEILLNERIRIIAASTNVSSDALSGIVLVSNPGVASVDELQVEVQSNVLTHYGHRQLQLTSALDTSGCDSASMRVAVEIIMQSSTSDERNAFMEAFDSSVLPGLIQNITGSGEIAVVCAQAIVTEASRATVDAPPPPPDLGLQTEPQELPRTVFVIAIIAAGLALVLGGACAWYYFGRTSRDEEDRPRVVDKFGKDIASAPGVADPGETSSFFGQSKDGVTRPAKRGVGYFALEGGLNSGTG